MCGNHARKAQAIRNVMEVLSKQKGPQRFTSQTKLISAAPEKCQFEFKVAERDLNMYGTLHGGISATIVDVLTNVDRLAISTELNMSYLGTAKEGDVVVFETELMKEGKTLNFLTCSGKIKDTESHVIAGRHTLINAK